MKTHILIVSILVFGLSSCRQAHQSDWKFSGKEGEVKIIQLDPTHGHAAAAQNEQIGQIDTNVYVYAPDRNDLEAYFEQIKSFNSRENNPTRWNEVVYIGKDFLQTMVKEKRGNVVVLAGNNRIKIDYIEHAVQAGMNVFSDKPMVIDKAGFERLKNAYAMAEQKGILMFDMMTERYSLLHNVQKLLMMDSLFFGKIQTGTPDHPAIFESSVHHYYRGGKGNRPAWFFDVSQQGEGIVDVTTHLIDLTFWKTFPCETIDYNRDVKVLTAKHWPVNISKGEFSTATSLYEIPASLKPFMKDTLLEVFANGSINYQVKGINMGVSVEWRAATPKEGNDLRYASAEGTKAMLLIKQEYGQKRPQLYAYKGQDLSENEFQLNLEQAVARLQKNYPGISLSKESESTEIVIPSDLELSHDPTFKVFLGYLVKRDMPKWEVPNTLAKYYITTTALEMTKGKK